MEIIFNYSMSNNKEPIVGQVPISSASRESNCPQMSAIDDDANSEYVNELIKAKFNDATVIISVVILVLINFVVIGGNILVILSVSISTKLRTVTNFFIGNFSNGIATSNLI